MKRLGPKEYEITVFMTQNEDLKFKNLLQNGLVEGLTINFENFKIDIELFKDYNKLKKYQHIQTTKYTDSNYSLLEILFKKNPLQHIEVILYSEERKILFLIEEKKNLEYLNIKFCYILQKEEFVAIKNIINQNLNLKKLILIEDLPYGTEEEDFDETTDVFDEIEDNCSLESLEFHAFKLIPSYKFLTKFKNLGYLEILNMENGFNDLLQNIGIKTLPLLNTININIEKLKIDFEVDFSTTSIRNFIFTYDENTEAIVNVLNGLLGINDIKTIKLFKQSFVSSHKLCVAETLQKVLINSKKLEILLFETFEENAFKVLIDGIKGLKTLKELDIRNVNMESLALEFGEVLSSMKLKKLKMDTYVKEIFSSLQYNNSIKELNITFYVKNDEIPLLSQFIQNNENLKNLIIFKVENAEKLLNLITSHNKIQTLALYFCEEEININHIISFIQNNRTLKHIYINGGNLITTQRLIEILSQNTHLKSFILGNFIKIEKGFSMEDLIYNFDLYFKIKDQISPYNERNSEFIKVEYHFHHKLFDTAFCFE